MPKIKDYSVPLPDISMEIERLIELTETCSKIVEIIQDRIWDKQESYPEDMWHRWMDARRDLSTVMEKYEFALYEIDNFQSRYTGLPKTTHENVRKTG